ncbi:hypothetical protein BHM03_00062465 [Ensete ventricosum]|nr:hypothetical protein BHM03_00062465 [Ensete ventricosum]
MKCDAECFYKANSRLQYEFGSRCMATRVREAAMIPRTVASCRVIHRSTIILRLIQLKLHGDGKCKEYSERKDAEKPRLRSSARHTGHVHS